MTGLRRTLRRRGILDSTGFHIYSQLLVKNQCDQISMSILPGRRPSAKHSHNSLSTMRLVKKPSRDVDHLTSKAGH